MSKAIIARIASELKVNPQQVAATIALMDEGCTVPFIARYRKEATGELDDTQLRQLDERLNYLRELEDRRQVILKSIEEQHKLTPELKTQILDAESKTLLEDLYLPFKPKRRTKGQIAIESGLLPLADHLLIHHDTDPATFAEDFINKEANILTCKDALDGARYILMERFAEDALLLKKVRNFLWDNGLIVAKVIPGKEKEGIKFSDYFDFSEALHKIPSHRSLALFRGRNEGFLQLSLVSTAEELKDDNCSSPCIEMIAHHFNLQHQSLAADDWLAQVVNWTWRIKLLLHMETELFCRLREQADEDSIKVFAHNLHDLLMAAPAGKKVTMGLDPGLRTGVKVVVVDDTGKLLHSCTIFPHVPQKAWLPSLEKLKSLCTQFSVDLISIGNGTGSRETDKLVIELLKSLSDRKIDKLVVSEAGASIYSASELAAKEFPDLDVSYRGAVSIARRLQDPLAELVKIDPKSIGVGQYQHDVSQVKLARSLDAVVEDCVNTVGVDLNMASAPLLTRVSGLNRTLAQSVVDFRDQNGRFVNRSQLKQVPRLGPKAFEQSAGFLKICDGDNPLDASSVHPEAYPLVEKIMQQQQSTLDTLIGNRQLLRKLDPKILVDSQFGLPTIRDVLSELEKPGRDPRPAFQTASFKEGIEKISDLNPNMKLEGVVTNVTNFGAFVDIGVHQDGLVHISMMADKFISDPREIVKAGDIVKVTVMEVDASRKRIALSMKSTAKPARSDEKSADPVTKTATKNTFSTKKPGNSAKLAKSGSAFADALSAALKK